MTDYFSRLVSETPTRVWVNNPTRAEIELALAHGAIGCTTNPAFGGGLLRRAPGEVTPIVDTALAEHPEADDKEIADLVQERLVGLVAAAFLPMFDTSGGTAGFVSIQGSPEADMDGERIWAEAQTNHRIGPNVAIKLPATLPGFVAMERAVGLGWPIIVTEVFSLDQVAATCELYLRVTARTGVRGPFYMSPITGILGDHLKKLAKDTDIDISVQAMELAGVGLARRCAALVAERDYPVVLLFGGLRVHGDLTGLVGGHHQATINWPTFSEVMALDPPIRRTIDEPLPPAIERMLLRAFPDAWKAWELGRLAPEEFEDFGPVQHFRDVFVAGWRSVVSLIADRRTVGPATEFAPIRD